MDQPTRPFTHDPTDITGYRPLTDADIELVNTVKARFNSIGELLEGLAPTGADPRSLALAKTAAQEAAMWAIRSITQPSTFA